MRLRISQLKSLLIEGHAAQLASSYPQLVPEIHQLISAGITGSVLDWAVGSIKRTGISAYRHIRSIKEFEGIKHRLPPADRDITRYQSIDMVESVIDDLPPSNRELDKKISDKETISVYSSPFASVYLPLTAGASRRLGHGTKWCTSARGSACEFDTYAKEGLFPFVIILRMPDIDEDLRKLTWVVSDEGGMGSIYTANDTTISGGYLRDTIGTNEFTRIKSAIIDTARNSPKPNIYTAITTKSEDVMRNMVFEKNPAVRIALAENPNVTLQILELLAKDVDNQVRIAVAQNKKTPRYILEWLAIHHARDLRDREILSALATNPAISPAIAQEIYEDGGLGGQKRLAKNPATPVEILKKLCDVGSKEFDKELAQNIAISPMIVRDLYDRANGMPGLAVKIHLAKNPNTPQDILRRLATDALAHQGIRLELLHNPNTPKDVLTTL